MQEYEHKIFEDYVEFYLYDKDKEKHTYYVDLEDWDRIINFPYRWTIEKNNKCYYLRSTIYLGSENGKSVNTRPILHRWILNYKGKNRIDHINHNGLDNRKKNLRIIEACKNSEHRESKNCNNKTGYRNVFWNNRIQKYTVSLCHNYKTIHIGDFDDVDKAGLVAEEARKKYYGEYAGSN